MSDCALAKGSYLREVSISFEAMGASRFIEAQSPEQPWQTCWLAEEGACVSICIVALRLRHIRLPGPS